MSAGRAIRVRVRRLHDRSHVRLPKRASPGSAGYDLAAAISEPVELPPGARRSIPTGLTLEIPAGYEAQVRPRSGRALRQGLTVLNSPGTIDSDYRGEVVVLLVNLGQTAVTIQPGDRLAQLVLAPVLEVSWEEVADPLEPTVRGAGGFGSSGR
ncbi:MAG TPA: dUTP diphosphatase [Thermoanaerobaculia bacterium]|nr:dUTP diphosphatase [Thermoanaerobaculia bacterium]